MSLWKLTEKGFNEVEETNFKKEKILEENLENWIIINPLILGEKLLIIGNQVMVSDVKDKIDILALDSEGNSVIIELKRGKLKDPVDIQALRYASYISRWKFEDFEKQAKNFLNKEKDPEFNFNELFEDFCSDSGIEDVPDINIDQRVIIVGTDVKDKIGSVALWLRDHQINIKVIQISVYKDNGNIFIEPDVVIPLPVSRFETMGKGIFGDGSKSWLIDGEKWHLEKRCSSDTRDLLIKLNNIIKENLDLIGPYWNQKFYLSFKKENTINLYINTYPTTLKCNFVVKSGKFKKDEIAKRLNIKEFNIEDTFSEKFNLPSSITVKNINEYTDKIVLRIKKDFDLENKNFIDFLKEVDKDFIK